MDKRCSTLGVKEKFLGQNAIRYFAMVYHHKEDNRWPRESAVGVVDLVTPRQEWIDIIYKSKERQEPA